MWKDPTTKSMTSCHTLVVSFPSSSSFSSGSLGLSTSTVWSSWWLKPLFPMTRMARKWGREILGTLHISSTRYTIGWRWLASNSTGKRCRKSTKRGKRPTNSLTSLIWLGRLDTMIGAYHCWWRSPIEWVPIWSNQ